MDSATPTRRRTLFTSETASAAAAPAKPPKPQLFTPENAAEMARRSALARQRNKAAKELRRATALVQAAAIKDSDEYVQAKLIRVRAQIAMLDEMLESAPDAREAKASADALARLYEIESYLSGRPKPGSRRPGREKPVRQLGAIAGPLDAEY